MTVFLTWIFSENAGQRAMKRWILIISAMAAATVACSMLLGEEPTPGAASLSSAEGYGGIDPGRLGRHESRFTLQFQGEDGWLYVVRSRYGETAVEKSLHIEGVEDAVNPGDVRMVTEGGISRMVGPGTEGQCLQFPEGMGVNITFLNPDDVFAPEALQDSLVEMGRERVGGWTTEHFALTQTELDGWEEVTLDLWIEPNSRAVMRYSFQATGWDPFFRAGRGRIEGEFEVAGVGPQTIEAIGGCEVALPLPEEHRSLVVLPGVVAFESPLAVDEVAEFYRDALADTEWRPLDREERASGAMILSYRDGARTLDITIRQMDEFTRVELLSENP